MASAEGDILDKPYGLVNLGGDATHVTHRFGAGDRDPNDTVAKTWETIYHLSSDSVGSLVEANLASTIEKAKQALGTLQTPVTMDLTEVVEATNTPPGRDKGRELV